MYQELIDLFRENYFLVAYGVALVISMATYRKYFDTALRYFPIIIAYTFFNELLGYFIRYKETFAFFSDSNLQFANDIIYNIYYVVFFCFFYFLYWKIVNKPKLKKWISWSAYFVLLAYIVNSFIYNPLTFNLFYAHSIGSWVLVFCILLYFGNLPNWKWDRDKYNLMIWVSIGLCVFYSFYPPLLLIGFLKTEIWQQYHLRTVLRILIVIMYFLFCIGFVISRRRAFK
ncbi:hypothetical protein VC82_654 [Flagellimonas lutaonensis]|uniref:Uncharacterized protein n=1 Tax=Flagellimonas lutaonensis TaxID=516051 RepID=A0A0D5YPT1_9FLAO|nr:hypothetical protein VC82_654 [Allomuricauda lutaonensis]